MEEGLHGLYRDNFTFSYLTLYLFSLMPLLCDWYLIEDVLSVIAVTAVTRLAGVLLAIMTCYIRVFLLCSFCTRYLSLVSHSSRFFVGLVEVLPEGGPVESKHVAPLYVILTNFSELYVKVSSKFYGKYSCIIDGKNT
jgi:hypothetical protein